MTGSEENSDNPVFLHIRDHASPGFGWLGLMGKGRLYSVRDWFSRQ